MKKEDAKALGDRALEELATALAAGRSQELERFLRSMGSFHDYSFGNVMLILRQFPEASRVAGFRAWQKLGRYVKKGEKGICILAPLIGKKQEADGTETSGVFGFRAAHVFDVSQTDGDRLPDINRVTGDPGESLELLVLVIRQLGIEIVYEDDLGGAAGVSRGGQIAILADLPPAEAFSTLGHEVAHELLHRGQDRKTLSKAVKELEAEAVAYVVSTSVGLTGTLQQASDYIQCHAGDAGQLAESLTRIQKTASQLIESMSALSAEPSGRAN